jgi:hypothetical protein
VPAFPFTGLLLEVNSIPQVNFGGDLQPEITDCVTGREHYHFVNAKTKKPSLPLDLQVGYHFPSIVVRQIRAFNKSVIFPTNMATASAMIESSHRTLIEHFAGSKNVPCPLHFRTRSSGPSLEKERELQFNYLLTEDLALYDSRCG